MAHYLLAKDAYLCVTDDHAVILDLQHDTYLALSRENASTLADSVAGWPQSKGWTTSLGTEAVESDTSVLRTMLDRGLLTADLKLGKKATPVEIEAPGIAPLVTALLHTLLKEPEYRRPRIRSTDVMAFLRAYVIASFGLRYKGLQRLTEIVAERHSKERTRTTDPSLLRTLLYKFRLIRPFFYTAANGCLFDSLVLVEYLARYRVSVRWIFGVTTCPFAAHSWVQAGTFVLNDTPEHAKRFTPIMVV